MSQRHKSKQAKADRAAFFRARASALKSKEGLTPSQDDGGVCSRDSSPSHPATPSSITEEGPLTVTAMRAMMAEFSVTIQGNVTTQIQALATELRKEIHDIGSRSTCMDQKMANFAGAHNSLADKMQEIDEKLQTYKLKLADKEYKQSPHKRDP
ncbi:Hypothetical predicted protein [Pelobates cultripes]|uniref:Uncharacterized protein n=1 Tax=Pelobates cultripes TaxID=61616 RepID=A0AAD1VUW5_PELCU|nr:Hypothetical predicted protein [Pelobates cultripes]